MTRKYLFPKIDNVTITSGYSVVTITAGVAEIDEKDATQMGIVKQHGATPVPAKKASKNIKAGK